MATLSVQVASADGLINPTFAAAAGGGDDFPNDGKTVFILKNGDASPHTPTFDSIVNCNQGFDHNAGGAVAASQDGYFGPFDVNRFGNSVAVTYDGVTSVTVAAIRVS